MELTAPSRVCCSRCCSYDCHQACTCEVPQEAPAIAVIPTDTLVPDETVDGFYPVIL